MEPLNVDGEDLKTPKRVILTDSFFREDNCNVCGICCSGGFNTVYTSEGISRITYCPSEEFKNPRLYGSHPIPEQNRDKLLESMITHTSVINGKEYTLYESPCLPAKEANNIVLPHKPNAGSRCRWMIDDVPGLYRCGIHPIRSITCGIPHCRFNYSNGSDTTKIGLGQYGRNWRLGCTIDLKNTPYNLASLQERKKWLSRLNDSANDLEIKTVLPYILEYIDTVDESVLSDFTNNPNDLRVCFYINDGKCSADENKKYHKRLF